MMPQSTLDALPSPGLEHSLRLVWSHALAKFMNHLRQPSYVIGTLVFPSMFFLFFASSNATSLERANLLLASFAAFAVLGVVFFQFGMDLAAERETAWFRYLRTLPVATWQFFAARCASALAFALLAAGVVAGVVILTTPAHLTANEAVNLAVALGFGSLPFCLMGLALGSFVPSSSALPIINLVYLMLSFAGGLWIPPAGLSATLQKISVYLPTRLYGEWAWAASLGQPLPTSAIAGLFAYALLFLPLAWLGHRRTGR